MRRGEASRVVILVVLVSGMAAAQAERWRLPVADGGETEPSPPSVHGYVIAVAKHTVMLKQDSHDAAAGKTVKVRLTSKTHFFTAYGGLYTPDRLRAGQYVWIWYITADPARAGTPPRAAVTMLWSQDPSDKPSRKVRWSFDK